MIDWEGQGHVAGAGLVLRLPEPYHVAKLVSGQFGYFSSVARTARDGAEAGAVKKSFRPQLETLPAVAAHREILLAARMLPTRSDVLTASPTGGGR